ncbi:hypothetical protein R3P38DRAFT_2800886 [Favolaschia claudopus]|uniref:Alpha-type protein kinase domain-containing protein n=1 Tax=Favolaschia claudopus TaxID=2862362 RepID=A0AAV9ZVX6_9AGAR
MLTGNLSLNFAISVTDFKLGIEVVGDGATPSPASGISLERYQAACNAQEDLDSNPVKILWLLEPGVRESTVIADLQTSATVNEHGHGINVLFDMMTHTTNGASGDGDHGQTGIDTFVSKHECVDRCAGLRLSQEGFAMVSKPGDSSDEEEEQG